MIARARKLRELMEENNLQGLLMTGPYNLRYLTDSTGATDPAMITLNKAFFVTDFRYTEQVAEQATGFTIVKNTGHIFDEVADLAERLQLGNSTFEEAQISFADYSLLEEILSYGLVPVMGLIGELREVEDKEEVTIIEKVCIIADQELVFVLEMIKPGMTEIEVANQLDSLMRSKEVSGVSFEAIVASSLRLAMPHDVASHKVTERGELITLDFGCYYEGHVSDMTRTFAIDSIQPRLKEIYDIVSEAQLKVLTGAKPGLIDIQLDVIAWDHIASYGYGGAFGHSTGHGVGLEIHKGPDVSFRVGKQFVPGNVITNEPGVHLPGVGGVRIEDDLLITAEGSRVLTRTPKELAIL